MASPSSTDAKPIHQADPQWTGKLASGMNWLALGVLGSIVFTAIATWLSIDLTMRVFDQADTLELADLKGLVPPWLSAVVGLSISALSVIFMIGCLRVTTEEPGVTTAPSLAMTRWTCVPAFAVNIPSSLALLASGSIFATLVSLGLKLAVVTLLSVGFPASLIYMRYLANRMSSPSLAWQAVVVFWGQFLAGILLIVCLVALAIVVIVDVERNAGANLSLQLIWIMSPGVLAIVAFFIWWVWLILCFRSRLARAHRKALLRHAAVAER